LDTASLVGHLVPAGSVYGFLAEHRGEVFPDGLFTDLFPSGRGRPSVPGAVIASVLVLQTLHDYSDAEAMDALRCDLRWKVACGLPIDHAGFHPTTLTVWRHRLRGSDRPERIFEAVRAVIAQTGVLKGKHRVARIFQHFAQIAGKLRIDAGSVERDLFLGIDDHRPAGEDGMVVMGDRLQNRAAFCPVPPRREAD